MDKATETRGDTATFLLPPGAARTVHRLVGHVQGRALLTLLLCLELGVWALPWVQKRITWLGADAEVYVLGGRAWLTHTSIYGFIQNGLPFTYPPIAAVLFAPLGALPGFSGTFVAIGVAAAALFGCIAATLRALGVRQNLLWLALLVFDMLFPLYPAYTAVLLGQIDSVLMLLALADLALPARRRPRGLLLGLAIAVKLTPAALMLYLAARRDVRGLIVATVSALAWTALGFVVAWSDSLAYWPHVFDASRVGEAGAALNQSWNGVVVRALGDGPLAGTRFWWWAGLSVLTVVVGWFSIRRLVAVGRTTQALVTTAVLALLISPISWTHHWIWVIPAILTLLVAPRHRVAGGLCLTAVAAFAIPPHWVLGTYHLVPGEGASWGPAAQLLGSAMVWWGVCFIVIPFWSTRESAPRKSKRS